MWGRAVMGITERYPRCIGSRLRCMHWPAPAGSGKLGPHPNSVDGSMTQSKQLSTASDAVESSVREADVSEVESALRVGDLVFTRIPWSPFRQVAEVTGTWTNHVGIVVGFRRT